MRDGQSDTDVQNSLLDSVGEGGMIWENGIETCIISYKKRIASLGSMQGARYLGLLHWDDRRDGVAGGRWDGGWGLGTRVLLEKAMTLLQYSFLENSMDRGSW